MHFRRNVVRRQHHRTRVGEAPPWPCAAAAPSRSHPLPTAEPIAPSLPPAADAEGAAAAAPLAQLQNAPLTAVKGPLATARAGTPNKILPGYRRPVSVSPEFAWEQEAVVLPKVHRLCRGHAAAAARTVWNS